MDAPDFAKYDEAQLRQILTRIDRERFPDRVALIETQLSKLAGEKAPVKDSTEFMVKPYHGATKKVFGPALPFIVVGAIGIGEQLCLSQLRIGQCLV